MQYMDSEKLARLLRAPRKATETELAQAGDTLAAMTRTAVRLGQHDKAHEYARHRYALACEVVDRGL